MIKAFLEYVDLSFIVDAVMAMVVSNFSFLNLVTIFMEFFR